GPPSATIKTAGPITMPFQLFSSGFADGGWLPALHSCDGADLSPSLEWSGAPSETRSFALIVEDPDAPAGVWCHWLLYDIGPRIRAMPQGYKQIGRAHV